MKYALLLLLMLNSCATTKAAGIVAATSSKAVSNNVTVYRCTDTKGKVSLQDAPCAKSSKQEFREMLRPKDAPVVKKNTAYNRASVFVAQPAAQIIIPMDPPPVLYQCTNYEGKTRDSENYDPNPRCEPLWVQGYRMEYFPIEQRAACSWVQDSCVRYEGEALCDRWKEKQKQAQSDLRYAFSNTSAFRKSDLARITQIVQRSCE